MNNWKEEYANMYHDSIPDYAFDSIMNFIKNLLTKARQGEREKDKEELIEKLKECSEMDDGENAHRMADVFLLEYINEKEVTDLFYSIGIIYT